MERLKIGFTAIFELALKPADLIERMVASWNPLPGVIFGVLGSWVFPAVALIAKLRTGDLAQQDVQHFFWTELPISVGYYVFACVVIFLAARLFGGRGNLFRYAPVLGWTGLFPVLWAVLLMPVMLLGPSLDSFSGELKILVTFVMVMPIFAIFALLIPWFRFQVAAISIVLELSYRRSVVVFLILALPLFLINDAVL